MRGGLILKYLSIPIIIYIIDFFGIFIKLFELNYEAQFTYPMEGDVIRWANEMRVGGKSDALPINELSFVYIHNISRKCNGEEPHLVLLIKSAVRNSQRRATIRRTWGSEQRFSDVVIRRVFLIGSSPNLDLMNAVTAEAANNNDILQVDFVDSYYNNTIKTLQGLHWAVDYCSKAHYFMFVDDDYYVSIKNVIRFVAQPISYPDPDIGTSIKQTEQELFAGYVIQSAPHRHKPSKWFVSLNEYPFNKWPPYVTAGAFVMSRKTLLNMYYVSLYTKLFRFDDIYLGIVALKANIKLTHCDQFHFYKPKYKLPESYSNVVASHGFDDTSGMERVWRECYLAKYA